MTDRPRIILEGKSLGEYFEQTIENKKLKDKLYAKEQECEELKKEIKSYRCNEKNANRCICAFRCLENTFCNEAENKIDEIQTKIKVLKIENEILSNKLGQEENWHKSADEISKVNSKYTVKLKAENKALKRANIHIDNNRMVKADKLKRIEDLIIACSSGYTDEFIQELLVILHEPEPIKE